MGCSLDIVEDMLGLFCRDDVYHVSVDVLKRNPPREHLEHGDTKTISTHDKSVVRFANRSYNSRKTKSWVHGCHPHVGHGQRGLSSQ